MVTLNMKDQVNQENLSELAHPTFPDLRTWYFQRANMKVVGPVILGSIEKFFRGADSHKLKYLTYDNDVKYIKDTRYASISTPLEKISHVHIYLRSSILSNLTFKWELPPFVDSIHGIQFPRRWDDDQVSTVLTFRLKPKSFIYKEESIVSSVIIPTEMNSIRIFMKWIFLWSHPAGASFERRNATHLRYNCLDNGGNRGGTLCFWDQTFFVDS